MDLSLTFLDIVKIRDSQPGVCVPLGVCKQVSGGTKCSKQNKNNSVTNYPVKSVKPSKREMSEETINEWCFFLAKNGVNERNSHKNKTQF